MCYGQCLLRSEPCHGVCFYEHHVLVNGTCIDAHDAQNLQDCLCSECRRCKFSEECILETDMCNYNFDCMDRTDEGDCDGPGEIKISDLVNCFTDEGLPGFICSSQGTCVPNNAWCSFNEVFEKTLQAMFHCSELKSTVNHHSLCQDKNFWDQVPNRCKLGSCNGNFPGQCAEFGCRDQSNKVGKEFCQENDFRKCDDNETCIHQDLFCDGYIQCPDGSDEDASLCQSCPKTFGYPAGKSNRATFSCKHKYTGRPICSVPCDGGLDLCENDVDESCSIPMSQWSLIFGSVILLISVVLSEVKMMYRDNIITYSSVLCENLFRFLKNLSKVGSKEFKSIHQDASYSWNCRHLSHCLKILSDKDQEKILKSYWRLEKEYHNNNITSCLKCIKVHFGTRLNTSLLFKSDSNKKQNFTIGPSFENVNKLKFALFIVSKITLYYSDFFKDSYIIAVFYKYSFQNPKGLPDELSCCSSCFDLLLRETRFN